MSSPGKSPATMNANMASPENPPVTTIANMASLKKSPVTTAVKNRQIAEGFQKLFPEMRLRVWELALQSRILRVHISSTLCMRYNNVDGINSINLRFSRAQHSLKGVCYETSDFMKKEKKTLPIAPAFHGNNLLNYKGDSDILLIEPGKYLRTTVWDCSTKPGWERYHNVHLRGIEKIGFNVQFPIFETATNHSDYINIAAQFGHLTTLVFFMEDEKHLTKLGCLEDLVCLFHIDRNLVLTYDDKFAALHPRFLNAIRWFKAAFRLYKEKKNANWETPEVKFMAMKSNLNKGLVGRVRPSRKKKRAVILAKMYSIGAEHWLAGKEPF